MIHFKRCAAFLAALALPMTIVPQTITAADSNQYAMNITVEVLVSKWVDRLTLSAKSAKII